MPAKCAERSLMLNLISTGTWITYTTISCRTNAADAALDMVTSTTWLVIWRCAKVAEQITRNDQAMSSYLYADIVIMLLIPVHSSYAKQISCRKRWTFLMNKLWVSIIVMFPLQDLIWIENTFIITLIWTRMITIIYILNLIWKCTTTIYSFCRIVVSKSERTALWVMW